MHLVPWSLQKNKIKEEAQWYCRTRHVVNDLQSILQFRVNFTFKTRKQKYLLHVQDTWWRLEYSFYVIIIINIFLKINKTKQCKTKQNN